MVGLPARGKTYIAMKLCRYLNWLSVETKLFNVGNYRRSRFGAAQRHAFFDPNNRDACEQRRQAAMAALEDMQAWFLSNDRKLDGVPLKTTASGHQNFENLYNNKLSIYDATKTTKARRAMIMAFCAEKGIVVSLFLFTARFYKF